MNNSLLRRVKRLETKCKTRVETLTVIVQFIGNEDQYDEWAPPEGENEAPPDLPKAEPRCVAVVLLTWHPAKGRNSIGPGERIVRDWYRDRSGQFYARERITSDPADSGRRPEVNSELAAFIQHQEDDFEADLRDPSDVCGLRSSESRRANRRHG